MLVTANCQFIGDFAKFNAHKNLYGNYQGEGNTSASIESAGINLKDRKHGKHNK